MAGYPPVCRVCLAINVKLLPIADTPLQYVYERLASTLLLTTDMRPLTACYMCYALLRKSCKLMLMSVTAENLLTEIVSRNSKITKRSVYLVDRKAHKLGECLDISPTECIATTPRTPVLAPPPANLVQHQPHLPTPLGSGALEVSPMPGPAIEIKIEEPHIKTEYKFEEIEAVPSPPAVQAPAIYDDIAMDTNSASVSETQQQPSISIELGGDEPDISPEQPEEESHIATEHTVSGQHTPCLFVPRPPGEKLYECPVCHRKFKKSNVYKNHLRTHTGEKPFACHLCERQFSVSANLRNHLKTHSSEKPFQCVLCNCQYRRLDHLKRHIETHKNEKPFQCTVCNRGFTRKYHLNRHSSVHTGEKHFECNICQWRFNNNDGLQKHIRTHTGKKLYSCDVCKAEFKLKVTLRSHIMANNGDQVFKCKKCRRRCHYRSRNGLSKMCKKCCLKRKGKRKILSEKLMTIG